MKPLFLLGLALFSGATLAADLKPFEASFAVSRNGKELGTMAMTLSAPKEGDWLFVSRTEGKGGLAGFLGEQINASLAGLMAGPIVSVQSGMGEPILILTLVVIVTGGIGSIRGAFYGALIVGIVDTIGRAFLPTLLREFLERSIAQAAGPAIASMLIYLLMAAVLALKPQGLFPVKHG